MKRIAACLLVLLFAAGLASCAKEPSRTEVVRYVTDAVGESVSFLSAERKNGMTYYKFLLDDRQFPFETVVRGDEISIYYEQGIAAGLASRRDEISIAFGVRYDDGVIDVRDHESAAAFIVALDALYAFKEEIPERFVHISGGTYDFGSSCAEGIAFSTNAASRIDTQSVLTYLAEFSKYDAR